MANIKVVRNSSVNELRSSERGASICSEEKWYIIYDDTLPHYEARMVIAHELGHIFLGHKYKLDEYRFDTNSNKKLNIEKEADMFALRLLAPACVLHELELFTPEKIEKVCCVPYKKAIERANRMNGLEKRSCFYKSELEVQVIEKFKNFILEYKDAL